MALSAKELMIGDWVYAYESLHNQPHRSAIKIGSLSSGLTCQAIGGKYADYDAIEPIPLTAEILEKNGFHTNYDHTLLGSCIYRRMCGKYDEYEVVVRMLNGWIKIKSHDDRVTDILAIDIQPRYVHKLQHALRLCGLNELADNFKV